MFSYYQQVYGEDADALAAVAMQLRQHAIATPNAVIQQTMSIDDYKASRYIVRPLRLFDICMVNDGAVCLIVTSSDKAREFKKPPVQLAGWGEAKVKQQKMRTLVYERLRPQMQEAGKQALDMAGLVLGNVQHFECYDVASIHLVNQLEGFGFVPEGKGLGFCRSGEIAPQGRLPVNTSGGNLSGSYMQGWGQVAEIVRQLRGEAGAQQVKNLEVSMSALVQSDQAHPLLFVRGE